MTDELKICKHCYHPLILHDGRRFTKYCDVIIVNSSKKRHSIDWACECPGFEELSS